MRRRSRSCCVQRGVSLICHGRCQTRLSLSPSLSVKTRFQSFVHLARSLTHISSFDSSLLFSSPLPFPICIPSRRRGLFCSPIVSPSLSLLSALNVPNSRENGRAIETAQQKKVIIKLAHKMTLAGAGVGPLASRLPPSLLFWVLFSFVAAVEGRAALNFRGGAAAPSSNTIRRRVAAASAVPPPPAERGRKEC